MGVSDYERECKEQRDFGIVPNGMIEINVYQGQRCYDIFKKF